MKEHIELDTLDQVFLQLDALVLDHGKEVSQSSSTSCPRIYVGRFLFSSGSPLPCSYFFGMTEQARARLFRGIAYGIGVCCSRKSLQSGYRLSGIHSYTRTIPVIHVQQ